MNTKQPSEQQLGMCRASATSGFGHSGGIKHMKRDQCVDWQPVAAPVALEGQVALIAAAKSVVDTWGNGRAGRDGLTYEQFNALDKAVRAAQQGVKP